MAALKTIDDIKNAYNRLKSERKVLNWGEFSELVGYDRTYVSRVLNEHEPLTQEMLDKISIKLNETENVPHGTSESNSQNGTPNQAKPVLHDAFMETHYVPRTSYAGYLRGHADPVFIESLPTMLVPKEFDKGHYLVFEVQGNSMDDGTQRAIMDGDKILAKELDKMHWKNKLYYNRNIFVIANKDEGIVVKQILSHDVDNGIIVCHSWNDEYEDFTIKLKNVYKLFYVKKIVERKIQF